jgi:glutathione peroxidase
MPRLRFGNGCWESFKKESMRIMKKTLIVVVLLIISLTGYVQIANRNHPEMSFRQKMLKTVYPMLMWMTRKAGANSTVLKHEPMLPPESFFNLQDTAIDGTLFDFSACKGKKTLLVNTASDCGYTRQYEELQRIHEQYGVNIIGFPANDFKQQEKSDNASIAEFCKRNYGVSFPLMQKSQVVSGEQQNRVFQWLTQEGKNGWNTKNPSWNFSKYVVDEEGRLVAYFDPSVAPDSEEVLGVLGVRK